MEEVVSKIGMKLKREWNGKRKEMSPKKGRRGRTEVKE